MAKRLPKATIQFSREQLIHLRRFLNRTVACCQGKCPGYPIPARYYLAPILKEVERALGVLPRRKQGQPKLLRA